MFELLLTDDLRPFIERKRDHKTSQTGDKMLDRMAADDALSQAKDHPIAKFREFCDAV